MAAIHVSRRDDRRNPESENEIQMSRLWVTRVAVMVMGHSRLTHLPCVRAAARQHRRMATDPRGRDSQGEKGRANSPQLGGYLSSVSTSSVFLSLSPCLSCLSLLHCLSHVLSWDWFILYFFLSCLSSSRSLLCLRSQDEEPSRQLAALSLSRHVSSSLRPRCFPRADASFASSCCIHPILPSLDRAAQVDAHR